MLEDEKVESPLRAGMFQPRSTPDAASSAPKSQPEPAADAENVPSNRMPAGPKTEQPGAVPLDMKTHSGKEKGPSESASNIGEVQSNTFTSALPTRVQKQLP